MRWRVYTFEFIMVFSSLLWVGSIGVVTIYSVRNFDFSVGDPYFVFTRLHWRRWGLKMIGFVVGIMADFFFMIF